MSSAESTGAPAVIVAQVHPSASSLQSLVGADGMLACTAGTGLLPFCDHAVAAWRALEEGAVAPSPLASKSIRSVVSLMRTVVLSRSGGREWCEISTAPAQAAEAFLWLYPDAKIACVYCHVSALTGGSSSRQLDQPGAPNTGLRIWIKDDDLSRCRYWAESAASMLAFEEKYPANCRRFRYEDVMRDPKSALLDLRSFFGFPCPAANAPPLAAAKTHHLANTDAVPAGAEVPPEVWREVTRLLSALDYVS